MFEYDKHNPPTIQNQWNAWKDELAEFVESVQKCDMTEMWKEGMDCIHSFLRLVTVLSQNAPLCGPLLYPSMIWLPLLGWPTAKKHALQWKINGCIRSSNHCSKNPCDHICMRVTKDN